MYHETIKNDHEKDHEKKPPFYGRLILFAFFESLDPHSDFFLLLLLFASSRDKLHSVERSSLALFSDIVINLLFLNKLLKRLIQSRGGKSRNETAEDYLGGNSEVYPHIKTESESTHNKGDKLIDLIGGHNILKYVTDANAYSDYDGYRKLI